MQVPVFTNELSVISNQSEIIKFTNNKSLIEIIGRRNSLNKGPSNDQMISNLSNNDPT